MICPRSHSQEAEKPSWNQGLTVPRSHIGIEWWEVRLRLECEAVDEVCAQHGLGVCPSRAAFPDSLTFQTPSDPPLCAPRIRYRDGLQAPSMVPASPLPGHRACPWVPSARCSLEDTTCCHVLVFLPPVSPAQPTPEGAHMADPQSPSLPTVPTPLSSPDLQ